MSDEEKVTEHEVQSVACVSTQSREVPDVVANVEQNEAIYPQKLHQHRERNMFKREFNEHRVASLIIQHDEEPADPREWSNIGTMVCWHRRQSLGDVQVPDKAAADQWLKTNAPAGSVVLPLYLLDHGDITMSTKPFSCPWDSGQVGWISAAPSAIRTGLFVTRITDGVRKKVTKILEEEVATYNLYLTEQCWGYVIVDDEGNEDSCWGFIGDTLESTGMSDALPENALPLLKAAWDNRFSPKKRQSQAV